MIKLLVNDIKIRNEIKRMISFFNRPKKGPNFSKPVEKINVTKENSNPFIIYELKDENLKIIKRANIMVIGGLCFIFLSISGLIYKRKNLTLQMKADFNNISKYFIFGIYSLWIFQIICASIFLKRLRKGFIKKLIIDPLKNQLYIESIRDKPGNGIWIESKCMIEKPGMATFKSFLLKQNGIRYLYKDPNLEIKSQYLIHFYE